MSFGVTFNTTSSGNLAMFEQASNRIQNTRGLMEKIGVLEMNSAVRRVQAHTDKGDGGTSEGKLAASLNVGDTGQGNENSVFRLSDEKVVVGSNLPYAAQYHHGGTIYPDKADALAIPMDPKLRRLGIGPRDLPEDQQERLFFRPSKSGKPNVIGVLLLPTKTGRGRTRLLFTLALLVRQEPHPFLLVDDNDLKTIREDLLPAHLELD